MARRKTAAPSAAAEAFTCTPPPELDWTITEEITVHGRIVTPGVEVSISGQGGTRFIFVRHVSRPSGTAWVDVIETYRGLTQAWRSFRPDRIKTVHRLTKARPTSAAS